MSDRCRTFLEKPVKAYTASWIEIKIEEELDEIIEQNNQIEKIKNT